MTATDDDPFGFGPPARGPGDRYHGRPPTRPWTPKEELCLPAVLLYCDSRPRYAEAAEWLCRTLDRFPLKGPNEKWTPAVVARECVAQVHMRTITRHLSGNGAHVGYHHVVYGGLRAGLPLTWGEKVHFLQPWHKKPANKQPRLPLRGLLAYLERPEEDEDLVGAYLASLPPDGARDEEPGGAKNYLPAGALEAFLRSTDETEDRAWRDLHAACRG